MLTAENLKIKYIYTCSSILNVYKYQLYLYTDFIEDKK